MLWLLTIYIPNKISNKTRHPHHNSLRCRNSSRIFWYLPVCLSVILSVSLKAITAALRLKKKNIQTSDVVGKCWIVTLRTEGEYIHDWGTKAIVPHILSGHYRPSDLNWMLYLHSYGLVLLTNTHTHTQNFSSTFSGTLSFFLYCNYSFFISFHSCVCEFCQQVFPDS